MAGKQLYQLLADNPLTPGLTDAVGFQPNDAGATEMGASTWQAVKQLIVPYKSYVAKLTQSGTSAPTAVVLQNELGGTVVWSRASAGRYLATLAGAFTLNKTVGFMNASVPDFQCQPFPVSADVFEVDNQDLAGANIDGALFGNCIEIRVYY